MTRVGIRHQSVVLGQKVWYRELPDVAEQIRHLQIPDEEEIWNWGFCRRSEGGYDTHVADGFANLAAALRADAIAIDAVLCCDPVHNDPQRFVAAVTERVLPSLDVPGERMRRVEGRECVNVIQAVADASALLREGHGDVLIVAAEQVDETRSHRLRKYSMFSDFCLALVVSRDLQHCAWEVLDVQVCADANPGEDTGGILMRQLEKDCVERLLSQRGLTRRDVSRFFYLNLFEPIAEMKAKQIGFTPAHIYTQATRDRGHCYGADPFINLEAYASGGGGGATHMLCASGRASMPSASANSRASIAARAPSNAASPDERGIASASSACWRARP